MEVKMVSTSRDILKKGRNSMRTILDFVKVFLKSPCKSFYIVIDYRSLKTGGPLRCDKAWTHERLNIGGKYKWNCCSNSARST